MWIVTRISVPWTASPLERPGESPRSNPSSRDQRPMYADGAYCVLDAAQPARARGERQPRALEQELAREQRAVELALRSGRPHAANRRARSPRAAARARTAAAAARTDRARSARPSSCHGRRRSRRRGTSARRRRCCRITVLRCSSGRMRVRSSCASRLLSQWGRKRTGAGVSPVGERRAGTSSSSRPASSRKRRSRSSEPGSSVGAREAVHCATSARVAGPKAAQVAPDEVRDRVVAGAPSPPSHVEAGDVLRALRVVPPHGRGGCEDEPGARREERATTSHGAGSR